MLRMGQVQAGPTLFNAPSPDPAADEQPHPQLT